jgi:hypothetical protein
VVTDLAPGIKNVLAGRGIVVRSLTVQQEVVNKNMYRMNIDCEVPPQWGQSIAASYLRKCPRSAFSDDLTNFLLSPTHYPLQKTYLNLLDVTEPDQWVVDNIILNVHSHSPGFTYMQIELSGRIGNDQFVYPATYDDIGKTLAEILEEESKPKILEKRSDAPWGLD